MEMIIALTLFLAFFFVVLLSRRSKPYGKKHLKSPPPVAGGAWPIIGHLHLLASSQPPAITLGNLADKHGPIFTIKLGQHKAVIVSRWDIAKECFTTHDLLLLTRPESLVADVMSYDFAMIGFSPYGPYWREMRKLTSVGILSSRRLELLKKSRVSEIEMSTKELYNLITSSSSTKQLVVEMKEWFGDLTLNIILRMVAGQRFFGVGADDDEEARRVRKVLRGFLRFVGLFLPEDSFPILKPFDIGGQQKKMKGVIAATDKLVGEWLEEHRRNPKGNQVSVDHDFMDVMISMMDEADIDANYDPDTIIKSTCINLIAGASDTTAVTLTWALACVVNNREVLRKIQEELDIHVGKDRRLTDVDIPKLTYLQAVVKETLRLYPAGPIGGPRKLAEDTTIGGYHIAKGTRLIVNIWKLQRDPNVWVDDPMAFKPERFLTTHKDLDVKGHNFELIPFSAGRRNCPGMHFAMQMLHAILANLFHAFDVEVPGGRKIELKQAAGLTGSLVGTLELILTPRLLENLY